MTWRRKVKKFSSVMRRSLVALIQPFIMSSCIGLLVALGACDTPTDPDDVRFEMTFTGDASFQGPHAGDMLTVRRWRIDGPLSEWLGSTHVIPDPSQDNVGFSFRKSLVSGERYDIYLWIDSNIGGGTVGFCDPPAIDHQWNVAIPTVTGDVNIIFSHDDATVTDVCSVFDGLDL